LRNPDGFIIGPKSFSAPGELAKTVTWEVYRLEAQDGLSESVDSTGPTTNAAEAFSNATYLTLMGEAEGYQFGLPGDPEIAPPNEGGEP